MYNRFFEILLWDCKSGRPRHGGCEPSARQRRLGRPGELDAEHRDVVDVVVLSEALRLLRNGPAG
jgi:hypothetical protein